MDVQAIRHATGLSQAEFAQTYGLNVTTLRQWERIPSRSRPSGAAKTLLLMIAADPVKARELVERAAID